MHGWPASAAKSFLKLKLSRTSAEAWTVRLLKAGKLKQSIIVEVRLLVGDGHHAVGLTEHSRSRGEFPCAFQIKASEKICRWMEAKRQSWGSVMSLPGLIFNKINLSSLKCSKSCQWTYRNMDSDRNNEWNMDNFQPVLDITCYEMSSKGKRCLLFAALQRWGVIYCLSKSHQQKLFTYSWSPPQPADIYQLPTLKYSTRDNMVRLEHPSIRLLYILLVGHLISVTPLKTPSSWAPQLSNSLQSDPSFTSMLAWRDGIFFSYVNSNPTVLLDVFPRCAQAGVCSVYVWLATITVWPLTSWHLL